MIPLRALIRMNSFPAVTLGIIVINTLCFLFERILDPYALQTLIFHYGLVPAHLHLSSLVTSMFLHGGWMHLIGNMWFLWVFGSRVEDTLGGFRYGAYYLICGVAAALVNIAASPSSPIPTIGASGAIAGIMGGFMLLYPRARIVTLVILVVFVTTLELPALIMLLYWFLIQLFSGLSSFGRLAVAGASNVAWFAHVGGFLAGMLFIALFGGASRRSNYLYR
ncbi:MAG TPA: rhomboid family intramembrane serine protease [Bryobacteraceae bacterium]|nr:rhomboid family intramembrane serine protease [Bryobacteraceae bacterium]